MKAVILAGGSGTRLWPMSHDLKPKQFHAFVGDRTMLQQTFDRLSFLNPENVFVATNAQYADLVKKQLPELPKKHLIIEPALRDTGPCICHAANELRTRGFGEDVMAIVYADHLIAKPEEFQKTLLYTASRVEHDDVLGTIAVRAKAPNPNLGYIKIGRQLEGTEKGLEAYELDQFVEKPDPETAKKFLYSYRYLWNTGLYLWKINTIIEHFKRHAPEIYKAVVEEKHYESAPKISIDYAIMEKVNPKEVHVFPAELGWNDIGNWSALHEELAAGETDNVTKGKHIGIDTEGSVVYSETGKIIATVGVQNMIIVETEDAILLCPKNRAAEVKHIVEALKKQGKK